MRPRAFRHPWMTLSFVILLNNQEVKGSNYNLIKGHVADAESRAVHCGTLRTISLIGVIGRRTSVWLGNEIITAGKGQVRVIWKLFGGLRKKNLKWNCRKNGIYWKEKRDTKQLLLVTEMRLRRFEKGFDCPNRNSYDAYFFTADIN